MALNVMEASWYWPHNVHEPIPALRKCYTHPAKCTILQILQKLVAKPANGVSKYFPMNEDTDGFQVCDALSIVFKLEKLFVKHLEGFILLLKEGGKL